MHPIKFSPTFPIPTQLDRRSAPQENLTETSEILSVTNWDYPSFSYTTFRTVFTFHPSEGPSEICVAPKKKVASPLFENKGSQ